MQLDSHFTQLMTDMQTKSLQIGQYLRGQQSGSAYIQRCWMIPTYSPSFSPTNVPNLGTAFSRTALNTDYANQLSGGGTATGYIGHQMVDGIQINYLAMMERAFRERHKTDVRCQLHLCGRRIGHGQTNGVHTGSVQPYVQSLIDNSQVVVN